MPLLALAGALTAGSDCGATGVVTAAGMTVGTALARVSTGKSVRKSYLREVACPQVARSVRLRTGSSTMAEDRMRTTAPSDGVMF